jgi:hypothetical protein
MIGIDLSPNAIAECVEVACLDRDAGLKANVGGRVPLREEAPASGFKLPIDLDAGRGFLHVNTAPSLAMPDKLCRWQLEFGPTGSLFGP